MTFSIFNFQFSISPGAPRGSVVGHRSRQPSSPPLAASRTSRHIILLICCLTLLLSACGRSVMITVVDVHSGDPIPNAKVVHMRNEWRCMGIVPLRVPIAKKRGQTDEHGQITFKNVRDSDELLVGGTDRENNIGFATRFRPILPATETRAIFSGNFPDEATAAEHYRRLNENAPPDRITLPVLWRCGYLDQYRPCHCPIH